MDIEQLKEEINNLTKEEVERIADFANELHDTLDDPEEGDDDE